MIQPNTNFFSATEATKSAVVIQSSDASHVNYYGTLEEIRHVSGRHIRQRITWTPGIHSSGISLHGAAAGDVVYLRSKLSRYLRN